MSYEYCLLLKIDDAMNIECDSIIYKMTYFILVMKSYNHQWTIVWSLIDKRHLLSIETE